MNWMLCFAISLPTLLTLTAASLLPPGPAYAGVGDCTVTNEGANTIDATLFWIGDGGVGLYTLDGAGCNEMHNSILVGRGFGGDGTFVVENGATMSTSEFGNFRTTFAGNTTPVGNSIIRTGAHLTTGDCEVSSTDGSQLDSGPGTLTVTGAGTTLTCADELQVGYDGPGTMEVADMASVTAARLTSAFEGPGDAVLRVMSGATVEITGSNGACHTFGVRKTGLLDIDGGTLAFSDPGFGNLCTCTVSGCSIEVRVANGGLLTTELAITTLNDTTVTLDGGTVELPLDLGSGGGKLSICSSCSLQGAGTVSGALFNQGDVMPGLEMAIGRIDVIADAIRGTNGDVVHVSPGALVMEIAGEQNIDQIAADGDFTLTGNLQIRFINGFTPTPGTSFEIASAGGVLDFNPSSVQFFGLSPELEAESTVETIGGSVIVQVPEPGAVATSLAAFAALALLCARRSRADG